MVMKSESLTSWCVSVVVVLLTLSDRSHGVNFEPQVYSFQFSFAEVQENRTLFHAGFNLLLANNSVKSVEIPQSSTDIPSNTLFLFRKDDFGVQNIQPLSAGRYSFIIAAFIDLEILQAPVTINVISPPGRRCIEQSFGECHHNCRESEAQVIGYECYCDNGFVLHGGFDCFASEGIPQVYIINKNQIRSLNLVKSTYSVLLNLSNLTALDYNYNRKVLYAVTSNGINSSVLTYSLNSRSITTTTVIDNIDITSIATNWLNNEIYFVDRLSSSIMSFNMRNYSISFLWKSSKLPTHLLYSSLGYLVWVVGSSENTSIEQFVLENRSLTYQYNLSNIIDIAMSGRSNDVLALTDDRLFSLTLDPHSYPQTIGPFINGSIALDVFEVYSYLLLNNGSVVQIYNQNTIQMSIIVDDLQDTESLDISVYHELKQIRPSVTNCARCDGECLVKDGVSTCVCAEGLIVGVDGYSCQQSEASSYLASFSFKGSGVIVERFLIGPQQQLKLSGISREGLVPGNIYGMAINLEDGLIYYGDRRQQSIMQVSLNPLQTSLDDRAILFDHMNVTDMTFDWINKQLYWIDDTYHRIYRGDVRNLKSVELFHQAENQLLGIAVHPLNGLLYWSESSTGIKRKSINNSSSPAYVWYSCCAQAITIDHLSSTLYWFEQDANSSQLMEMSLTRNNSRASVFLSTDTFIPFRLAVLQKYILVTSIEASKLAVISREDYSVTLRPISTSYFALALVAPNRQPTEEQYACFMNNRNCTYTCVTGTNDPFNCTCPVGYFLGKDNITCSRCPPNTFSPDCIECNCVNGTCNAIDGTCSCSEGYTGITCDQPICDSVNCGENGQCSAPNFCRCDETYGGVNCTNRVCADGHCSFGGNCSVVENGTLLQCDCEDFRAGPQCQFPAIVFPIQGVQNIGDIEIGVSVGVVLSIVGIVVLFVIILGSIIIKRRAKKEHNHVWCLTYKNNH